jgi:glutamyl-tRNA synthetase
MGYSFGENKEIFSLQEFIDNFDIDKVSLGGPVFDLVKLGWVNNQHMRMKDIRELTELCLPFFRAKGYIGEEVSDHEMETLARIVEVQREGAQTMKEIVEHSEVYFKDEFDLPEVVEGMDKKEIQGIERLYKAIQDETGKKSIRLFAEKMENAPEYMSIEEAKALLKETLDEIGEGPGKVYMPLRAALTGQPKGADLYNLIFIIGKERTLKRLRNSMKKYDI